MKRLILLAFLFAIAITACDKIKVPNEARESAVGKNFIVKTNKNVSKSYKVLLEDYTGHTCGNCPKAAHQADSLESKYPTKLVVLAVHAGHFAVPQLPAYPDDYQTSAGTEWDSPSFFGISNAGNPNGLINRKVYPGNNLVQAYTKWKSTIPDALINDPFIVKLLVTTYYDPNVRALNVDVAATFQQDFDNDVKVSAVLAEDSIIGAQVNYSHFPDHDSVYVFNNMMRGSLKGTWGDVLVTDGAAEGETATVSYKNFAVNPKFNDKNLKVIVFAYNAITLEVIQAEKVKIR